MEVRVAQGSPAWEAVRNSLVITASEVSAIVGHDYGGMLSAWHFYLHVKTRHAIRTAPRPAEEQMETPSTEPMSPNKKHGIDQEPVIAEAYELLTGHRIRTCGVFLPLETDRLHGAVGASPGWS